MTRYKVETHRVSVRHIIVNANSEEEAKQVASDYVDKKSHINPTITYDKKLKKIKRCKELDWQSDSIWYIML